MARNMVTIYNEELTKRQEFQAMFDGHFLSALFRGLDDVVPPYAIDAPTDFDANLPNLNITGTTQSTN